MRVLQHLGIRLYSNVAAVVSELVANSWDADATRVDIAFDIPGDRISITDDGVGMTTQQINERFLTVGYEKRKTEGDSSGRYQRRFMGRKGIGKLSALSIADVVEIYSSSGSQHNALKINKAELENTISANKHYHPQEIIFDSALPKVGTTIVLRSLIKKRFAITVAALRKRVARRFSIIGHKGTMSGDKFEVFVDGTAIGAVDRDDLRTLEYLWEFGVRKIPDASVPRLHQRVIIVDNKIRDHSDWEVRGWFGTAGRPADLEQEESGSMRNIVVLARGRLIQESILDKLGFNRIFGSYVTGLIEADFLDAKDQEDIATSDRQRLIEDDPRVIALRSFMRDSLLDASETWSSSRRSKKADDAVQEHPALKKWLDELPAGQRPAASSMIGMIGDLNIEREDDRKNLYRSGVLAFERLRLKEAAHNLERLTSFDAEHLLPLLVAQDHFESALYADIVRTRIEAIKQFQCLTDSKAKETVLQQHLYDHLWLLDPGWERVEGSQVIESRLQRDFPKEFAKALTTDQKLGRVDIRYRKSSGTHIIVELKKYERTVKLEELKVQGNKYRAAMYKLAQQDGDPDPRVEVVFVLGQQVRVDNDAGLPLSHVGDELRLINARAFYYDQLIRNALAAFEDYLKANQKADRIDRVLEGISNPDTISSTVPMVLPSGQPAKRAPKSYPAKKSAKRGNAKKGAKRRGKR